MPQVLRSVAKAGSAAGITALESLMTTSSAESRRDHRPLELTEHADHLPQSGPHRIIRVVRGDLSRVDREDGTS
jgi:hypothetical protein